MTQLADLTKPFAARLVQTVDKGGRSESYVSHSTVNEKLLAVVGPFSFDVSQVVRGDVTYSIYEGKGRDRKKVGEGHLTGCVVGVICSLSCTVDGRAVTVSEVGDVESTGPWENDGERLKKATSDAFKRCAMRLGVGLHLWSDKHFFLHDFLAKQEVSPVVDAPPASAAGGNTEETT